MLELEPTEKITFYAVIWLAMLLLMVASGRGGRGHTIGLPLAFILSYTFAYGGALVHLIDGYSPSSSNYLSGFGYHAGTVADGLEATCIGMIGAAIAFALVGRSSGNRFFIRASISPPENFQRKALILIVVGGVSLLISKILQTLGYNIAGFQAVMSAFENLLIVGACAYIYHKHLTEREFFVLVVTLIFSVVLPIYRMLTSAILADSVISALLVVCFYMSLSGRKTKFFLRRATVASGLLIFAFLFSAAYMQSREVLRNVVWGGAGVGTALDTSLDLASKFDFGSLTSNETLALIESRINQNIFVGLAIQRVRSGEIELEYGSTIALALFAWVPRFIWSDKPERGGSQFLSRYTGIVFSQSSSFGAGTVLEFYINFGLLGVFFGLMLIGAILRAVDVMAYQALQDRDFSALARYILIGLALLAPLADVFFMMVSVVVAVLISFSLRSLRFKIQ